MKTVAKASWTTVARRRSLGQRSTWLTELRRLEQQRCRDQAVLATLPYGWDDVASEEWLLSLGFAPVAGSRHEFELAWSNLPAHWGPQQARTNGLCRTIAKNFDDRLAASGIPTSANHDTPARRPVRYRTREFAGSSHSLTTN